MIDLKNVKKENSIIYADYYPEWSKKSKKISHSIDNGLFEGDLLGVEYETKNHLSHAYKALMEMSNGEREIKDCKIIWY